MRERKEKMIFSIFSVSAFLEDSALIIVFDARFDICSLSSLDQKISSAFWKLTGGFLLQVAVSVDLLFLSERHSH